MILLSPHKYRKVLCVKSGMKKYYNDFKDKNMVKSKVRIGRLKLVLFDIIFYWKQLFRRKIVIIRAKRNEENVEIRIQLSGR